MLAMGAMLSQNVTRKSDQLVVYVSKLLNKVEKNYSTIKKEGLIMVFSCTQVQTLFVGQ
jgi:hypothetical protein